MKNSYKILLERMKDFKEIGNSHTINTIAKYCTNYRTNESNFSMTLHFKNNTKLVSGFYLSSKISAKVTFN